MFAPGLGAKGVASSCRPLPTAEPRRSATSAILEPTRSMTQRPADEWSDGDHDDGRHGRLAHRLAVLGRASSAVRRAYALAGQAADARATAAEAFRTALENRALVDGEREARDEAEARDKLKDSVRRFAVQLRTEGAPPEIGLRRVKSAVEPAIFSTHDHDGSDVEWRRAVAGDVVKWFVEAYYAA
jgi:hypothetical protein